jgi:hypothetical protein
MVSSPRGAIPLYGLLSKANASGDVFQVIEITDLKKEPVLGSSEHSAAGAAYRGKCTNPGEQISFIFVENHVRGRCSGFNLA